jgi:hypothetical protein
MQSVRFVSGQHCCADYLNLVWIMKVETKNVM